MIDSSNSAISKRMTRPSSQLVLKTLGLSVILVANIFLFVPFTLYIGNIEEFATPIWSILRLFSIPALIVIGLLIVAGGILSETGYRRYVVIIAVVGLLLWLQGYVMVWEYGLLDGSNIDWTQATWRGWIDLGVWISVILFSVIFYRVVEKPVVHFVFAIFSLQLVNFIYNGIHNSDELLNKAHSHSSSESLKEIHRFSSAKNALHILLDGFQADVFNEIITKGTEGEHYRTALEGFTFFSENIGVFTSTYMAIPAMLGEEIYANHMPKKEFVKKVFSGKTILNTAFNAGYEVDLASEAYMMGFYTDGRFTNAYTIPNNNHVTEKVTALNDSAKLLDLTLFRLVPNIIKKYVYNDQRWIIQNLFIDDEFLKFWYFAHTAFIKNLTHSMSADRTAPVYKYFHLMNTHWPMVVNNNCTYAGAALPRNRITVTAQSRCTLDSVIDMLNRMKELGIYNDAFIIIMADHGGHLPPYSYKPREIIVGNYVYEIDPWVVAMATPLTLIKTPGATGPLQISAAPTSMLDTAATINSILKLGGDFRWDSIMDLSPSENRERRFYFYEWKRGDWESDYTGPILEFIINGSVYDGSAWSLYRKLLPPADASVD
ncbi:MAG: hypothetical protein HW411_99 [Gammaproteobacteria bacterium]|nr:hypothetical protein [Gammaproteobacteria bacterium]